MCWNEKVSWTTFIFGSIINIFNILYFKTKTIIQISIVIQWLLLMQLFEALAWRDQNCGLLNKTATKGALIANLTQPLLVYLVFVNNSNNSNNKILATSIITLYIIYILYKLKTTKTNYNCLTTSEKCKHLDLSWWSDINGFIYCIALFSMILLLIKPFNLAIIIALYIAIALIASIMFYGCSVGSIWCWFVSFAPLLITFYGLFKDISHNT
jgi:hypothetical protein